MGVRAPLLRCHDVGRIQHLIETEILWDKILVSNYHICKAKEAELKLLQYYLYNKYFIYKIAAKAITFENITNHLNYK